jgi:hypothetical protein
VGAGGGTGGGIIVASIDCALDQVWCSCVFETN